MEPSLSYPVASARPLAVASPVSRAAFVRKVYGLFFASLAVSAASATWAMQDDVLPRLLPWFLPLVVAEVVLVFAASLARKRQGLNYVLLFGFTALSGVTLAPLLASYIAAGMKPVIVQALVGTVGTFGVLTAYTVASRKDFSGWGAMLSAGLWVMIFAGLANLFFASSALHFGLTCAGLLLFAGFVVYDTFNILNRYQTDEHVAGAIALYLDFINLFIRILQLLGMLQGGRRRD